MIQRDSDMRESALIYKASERTRPDNFVKHAWRVLRPYLTRRVRRVDRQLVTAYLRAYDEAKLHIGCGCNLLDGWLNCDLYPRSSRVLHLDATRPFPFDDDWFRYVFSEHMIEHIPYSHGSFMLTECRRILQPGGRIRISTPDLSFLIDLHAQRKSPLQRDYIEWATRMFIRDAPRPDDAFVINNFVRDWGHAFIYDEKTLRRSMEAAGFRELARCELGASEDAALRDLENEDRMPAGFLRLETMTLEGRK